MNKFILPSVIAAALALTACGKKEEKAAEATTPVVAPVAHEAAPVATPAAPAVHEAAPAVHKAAPVVAPAAAAPEAHK